MYANLKSNCIPTTKDEKQNKKRSIFFKTFHKQRKRQFAYLIFHSRLFSFLHFRGNFIEFKTHVL